jgi:phosphoenolpyruvate-protein kinase (PTS system EI component)
LTQAKCLLHEARARVCGRQQGSAEKPGWPAKPVEIGVLIEVPSAALMVEQLAKKVDFFSIGTNDLAQYVMASDRTNSSVARLADPLHPAVLKLISHVCTCGQDGQICPFHSAEKWQVTQVRYRCCLALA